MAEVGKNFEKFCEKNGYLFSKNGHNLYIKYTIISRAKCSYKVRPENAPKRPFFDEKKATLEHF